jgi:hypothetical protein
MSLPSAVEEGFLETPSSDRFCFADHLGVLDFARHRAVSRDGLGPFGNGRVHQASKGQ